ncbi:hypothetical protein [Pseudoclavibacter sp. 13-3]|uniref:hypothetical protein n=1 Tax=Pseudoclavibacter sp. 13-3 TaxID=2901228 RepID=UPI001E3B6DBE|nr:hypothetical protein [Pseudoclavibacter sp. 13-3]MCD7100441.1 hypothetical protein [Pseudoclavibacter sp. 13-3]
MSQIALIAPVLGSLAPIVQALLQRPEWSSRAKVILAVVFSVVLGTVTAMTSGQLDGLDWSSAGTWLGAVALVFASSQAAFVAWQKTGAFTAAEQVGAKTIAPQATDVDVPDDSEAARLAELEQRIVELESTAGKHAEDA